MREPTQVCLRTSRQIICDDQAIFVWRFSLYGSSCMRDLQASQVNPSLLRIDMHCVPLPTAELTTQFRRAESEKSGVTGLCQNAGLFRPSHPIPYETKPVQSGSVSRPLEHRGTHVRGYRHVELTLWPMSCKDDASGLINLAGTAQYLSVVLAMNSCRSSRSDWPRLKLSSLLRPRDQRQVP